MDSKVREALEKMSSSIQLAADCSEAWNMARLGPDQEAIFQDSLRFLIIREREAAIRAALSAAPAQPVVKKLEWRESHMPSWNGDYHTVPTQYTIRCADEDGWKWSHAGGFGYAHSPDAAKAAAQADFDQRIRSALTEAGDE